MATMFVRHTVSNYQTWRKVYDDLASVQKAKGVRLRPFTRRLITPTTSR